MFGNMQVVTDMRSTTMKKKTNWILIDYFDVYGNEEDGYEVNDSRPINIKLSENPGNREIFDKLYDMEYLKTNDMTKIQFDWIDDTRCEMYAIADGYPFGAVVKEV